ncbi:hypothetical protein PG997_011710 [Apiospora hydei]|uniref:Heterokaryon incompatibility domain-containing protein n=1 Tax=Apiospora hydei TaxID=1337664 RepID=A0ABR1V193_9PEZI
MEHENAAAFQYDPLQSCHIRILVVHPSPEPNEQMVCSLVMHNLQNSQELPYEALSYAWGDERATVPVNINQQPFLCRPNLHAALRRLRGTDKARRLWVDAICINQNDTSERSNQVGLMRTIYSQAQVVGAWLGESTTGSDKGMGFLKSMHDGMMKVHGSARPMRVGSVMSRGVRNAKVVIASRDQTIQEFQDYYAPVFRSLRDGDADCIDSLDEAVALLQRPWWIRMWTLQESVLGREVLVFCGPSAVPIDYFFEFSFFIFLSVNFRMWPGSDVGAVTNIRAARSTSDVRDHVIHQGHVSPLLALDSAWHRKASDPRDKVYGIMGLVGSAFDFEADYNSTVESVYTAAMSAVIIKDKQLTFFGLMTQQYELRNPKLPSWVPDLQLHSTVESDYISALSKPRFGDQVYNASLMNVHEDYVISIDGNVLSLSGIVVDQASKVGSQAPGRILTNEDEELQAWRTDMESILRQWRSLLPAQQIYEHTTEPIIRAFWRCVLADLRQGMVHPTYDPGRPTRLDENERQQLEKVLGHREHISTLLSFWASFCKLQFRQPRLIEQFSRRFFVTTNGFFGLGPPWLQHGDTICLLQGGLFIYAVRSLANGCWQYIGECYVHGIMDGELVIKAEQGLLAYQDFKIR